MKKTLTILFLLLLSGCADHINEKKGSHINVIPVTYTLSINSSSDEIIKKRVNDFIQKYNIENKKGRWELSIVSSEMKFQEDKYQRILSEFGYTINQIKTMELNESSHFTVIIAFITQRIEYEICDYEQIDYYGSTNIGCYTENNRWHSMVNPENAL